MRKLSLILTLALLLSLVPLCLAGGAFYGRAEPLLEAFEPPVSLAEFCGFDPAVLADATIEAMLIDCESGPEPLNEDGEWVRQAALHGVVLGKANEESVTGGTACFSFLDAEGQWIVTLEFYHGLLVRNDGMYAIEYPAAPEA